MHKQTPLIPGNPDWRDLFEEENVRGYGDPLTPPVRNVGSFYWGITANLTVKATPALIEALQAYLGCADTENVENGGNGVSFRMYTRPNGGRALYSQHALGWGKLLATWDHDPSPPTTTTKAKDPTCPDCEVKIGGLWRTGVCDECKHLMRAGKPADPRCYCHGTGKPVCCRCEGTGVDDPRCGA